MRLLPQKVAGFLLLGNALNSLCTEALRKTLKRIKNSLSRFGQYWGISQG
jgi:hypothetical protein